MNEAHQTVATKPDRDIDDELVHISCCVDDHVALCGTRVEIHVGADLVGLDCIVCGDLAYADHCPLGRPHCPEPAP